MGQHGKTAVLIVVTAMLGIAIAWAPMAIGSRGLRAPTLPAVDVGTPLAEPVITPADIQDIGTATLSGVNYLLAAGSLVVCFCALVVLSFMRAASRAQEIHVHRAVGASRKRLVLAGARESGLLALPSVVLGSLLGFLILRYAIATWPGTFDSPGFGP